MEPHSEEPERAIECYDEGCQLEPPVVDMETDKVVVGHGFVPLEEPLQAVPLKSGQKLKIKTKPKKHLKVGKGKKSGSCKCGAKKKSTLKTTKKSKSKKTVTGKGRSKPRVSKKK